jgi:hypothetical protein
MKWRANRERTKTWQPPGPLQAQILRFSRNRVLQAGLALIAGGVVCLYLSDQVVTGWWQGTLDAFGVGFVVGGLVDVLAITALNQALTGNQQSLENNLQGDAILRKAEKHGIDRDMVEEVTDHLRRSGRQIDLILHQRLLNLIAYYATNRDVRLEKTEPGYRLVWPPPGMPHV